MPIDILALTAALFVGLFGSLHCVAMCGGIAASISTQANGRALQFALLSNLGRVLGYAAAGAIVGGIGYGLVHAARLAQYQHYVRAFVGMILLIAAVRLLDSGGKLQFLNRPGQLLWKLLLPLQGQLSRLPGRPKALATGFLWGWLPCGLSVTMLGAAWFQASALHGGLLMLSFGIGTLPTMTALTWSGARILALNRKAWRYVSASVIAFAGLLSLGGPWLAKLPQIHSLLSALGCRSLSS